MLHKSNKLLLKEGFVILIKGDDKNKGKWKPGWVDKMFLGPDGIVRAVRLRAGKSFLERPLELLYPLELSCCAAPVINDLSTAGSSAQPITVLNIGGYHQCAI